MNNKKIDKDELLKYVDYTLLKQVATWEDIKQLCDNAIKYNTASVCIPPSFVNQAKQYVEAKVKICTVVGFPNGYNTTATKLFETQDAIENGAEEIDMVININNLKDKQYDAILSEINIIKKACQDKVLKVIVETCLLTEEEKIKMCEIISESNADYIKTSTGFLTGGATIEDIKLFKSNIKNGKGIKAAGGISSFESAKELIENGAIRLGISNLEKIILNNTKK